MASQNKPKDPVSDKPKDTATDKSSGAKTEEVLKPFQDAAAKFLQANYAAQESAIKQQAQTYFDLQDEVHKVEQEAYAAVMDANRKYLNKIGQPATGTAEETYFARAQSQFDYEKEVRQIYSDVQNKLNAISQRVVGEQGGATVKQYAGQRQDAYQTYLADIQQAWSGTKALDPQTMHAIASHIMFAISSS